MRKLNFKKIIVVCFLCVVMIGSFLGNEWASVFAYAQAENNAAEQPMDIEDQLKTEEEMRQTETEMKEEESAVPKNCYEQTTESAAVSLESEIVEENEPVKVSFFAENITDYYFESAGISVGGIGKS